MQRDETFTKEEDGTINFALAERIRNCNERIDAHAAAPGQAPGAQIDRLSYWIAQRLLAMRAQARFRQVIWGSDL